MLKRARGGKTSDPEPQAQRRRDAARTVRGLRTPSRRAGQHRSTQRLEPPPITDDEARLRTFLRELRKAPGRVLGGRQADRWRCRGLAPTRKRKKRLTGIGVHVGAMGRSDVLWALDFQFDTTVDGRTLKMLNVIDEFTRMHADRIERCRRDRRRRSGRGPDRLAVERGGPPAYVRMDNGPELASHAIAGWLTGTDSVSARAHGRTGDRVSTGGPGTRCRVGADEHGGGERGGGGGHRGGSRCSEDWDGSMSGGGGGGLDGVGFWGGCGRRRRRRVGRPDREYLPDGDGVRAGRVESIARCAEWGAGERGRRGGIDCDSPSTSSMLRCSSPCATARGSLPCRNASR